MLSGKEKRRMSKDEILELLSLRAWSRTKLAGELDVTENTVHQWISGRRIPSGPATILMRMWLATSRGEKGGRKELAGSRR
jgi:DNA-binding transcriptional regulator YiaG